MLNLATFNIFWYPESGTARNERDAEDERRIGRVLSSLACQVMVFQEILNLERLEELLKEAGSNLQLKSPAGSWLASDSQGSMKIACAYDPTVLELVDSDTLLDPVPDRRFDYRRYPYAMHLRHQGSGWEFTVVGVHFRSGLPRTEGESDDRRKEAAHLAEWLTAQPGADSTLRTAPATPGVLVMGDSNLVAGNDILKPLRTGAWHWPEPVVFTSLDAAEPPPVLEDPSERWTTFLDREVIDHVFTTPEMEERLVGDPVIYAFDLDPAMDEDPAAEGHWLRRETSYRAIKYKGAPWQVVENLYRISDHRPLRVTLDPG